MRGAKWRVDGINKSDAYGLSGGSQLLDFFERFLTGIDSMLEKVLDVCIPLLQQRQAEKY